MNRSYNKLVRDKIPQLIEESGRSYNSRILNEQEYFDALIDKVIEEIEEYRISSLEEEIADVYEALDCLIQLKEYEPMHLDYLQLIRKEARGSFKEKVLLIDVEDDTV
ncbi:MAG: nucleoside triphosphate pyrophosphohydrolase [Eubacteriales bacterium]|jgi:predicted house-cleaning noncanonical NTP pyrophosphatase (MazG superfamily)|nr:nucleoside triphosphate pyrophosphohydrolase [Eubacteriales bacterium]